MQYIIMLCARKRDALENPISGGSKMSFQKLEPAPRHLSEVQLALSEIQTETILLALPGLCLAGFLIILCAKLFPDPLAGGLAGLILLLISVIVWGLRQAHYLFLAWALVIGLLSAVLLPALWGEPALLSLLALPVGLASL